MLIPRSANAAMAGTSLEVMDHDAKKMHGERLFVFSNMKTGQQGQGQIKYPSMQVDREQV